MLVRKKTSLYAKSKSVNPSYCLSSSGAMKMPFSVLCTPILSTIKMKLQLFATVLFKCQTVLQTNWFQSSSAEFSSAACEPSSCLCFFVKPQQDCWGLPASLQLKIIQPWAAHLNRNHGQNTVAISEAPIIQTLPWKQQCKRNWSQWESLQLKLKLKFVCWALFPSWVLLKMFSLTRPVMGKICFVGHGKTELSLVLHMELLNNTEDINKDRVQVLPSEATPCSYSKESRI